MDAFVTIDSKQLETVNGGAGEVLGLIGSFLTQLGQLMAQRAGGGAPPAAPGAAAPGAGAPGAGAAGAKPPGAR